MSSVRTAPYLDSDITITTDDSTILSREGETVMDVHETPLMYETARKLDVKGKSVLNIGYGLGIIARAFDEAGCAQQTIVEAHPQIIARARSEITKHIAPTTLIEGPWQLVDYGCKSFDVIYFDTWLENWHSFLPTARRLLRPGGVFSPFAPYPTDSTMLAERYNLKTINCTKFQGKYLYFIGLYTFQ